MTVARLLGNLEVSYKPKESSKRNTMPIKIPN